jgi:hypothetical protein
MEETVNVLTRRIGAGQFRNRNLLASLIHRGRRRARVTHRTLAIERIFLHLGQSLQATRAYEPSQSIYAYHHGQHTEHRPLETTATAVPPLKVLHCIRQHQDNNGQHCHLQPEHTVTRHINDSTSFTIATSCIIQNLNCGI